MKKLNKFKQQCLHSLNYLTLLNNHNNLQAEPLPG
jgi:hypothetical protein